MDTNSQIEEKSNHKDTNYYNFFELNYCKPDILNQLDNSLDTYYIKDFKEYEYWHCKSHFFLNNKLNSYLW